MNSQRQYSANRSGNKARRPPKARKRQGTARRNRKSMIHENTRARRSIAPKHQGNDFDPGEDWHEPIGRESYELITREPGRGYRHVVTAAQVDSRLAQLPKEFLKGLEVVQLATMTRKKQLLPCYGLQWGCAIYLYPFDCSLEEHFFRPPPRQMVIETKMYGGRWNRTEYGTWCLKWTESTARDYQLNNILIHELGHMVDTWNTNTVGQERFAEWFAIEYGYLRSGGRQRRNRGKKTRRRHHGS